jgi:hypothetical protein
MSLGDELVVSQDHGNAERRWRRGDPLPAFGHPLPGGGEGREDRLPLPPGEGWGGLMKTDTVARKPGCSVP